MTHYFNQVEALVGLISLPRLLRLVRKHLVHQVLEFGAERGAEVSLMRSPEIVLSDKPLVFLVEIYLAEWHDSRVHYENDDAEGEQVCRDGLVAHAKYDLRRHVAGRADPLVAEAAFAIFSLNRAGKTKVNDFKVEICVEDQIFQLEIPMTDACLVKLAQADEELPRVELHHRHWQASRVSDVAEHVTVWGKLVGDAWQLLIAIRFYEGFDRTRGKVVWGLRSEACFSVERLHRHVFFVLEYFEGKVLSIFLCFEDIGCSAGTNFAQQSVASDCSLSSLNVFDRNHDIFKSFWIIMKDNLIW